MQARKTDASGSDDLAGAAEIVSGNPFNRCEHTPASDKKYIESDYLFFDSARTYVLPWKPDPHTGTI